MAASALAERVRTLTGGVRFRTTGLATLVVGLVLIAGGLALVGLTRRSLSAAIRARVEARALDLAALAASGTLPETLPETLPDRSDTLVAQVVATDGTLRASSAPLDATGLLSDARLAPGQAWLRQVRRTELPEADEAGRGDVEPAWLGARGVRTPDGEVTVLVAASLESVESATEALVPVLLAVLPAVLAVTSGAVWVLAGRALRPVEEIRVHAAAISAARLDRRVPVPASRDEVHRLAITVNDMLGRLEAAAMQQRQLVADASHELRSPIAALRTMLEVAQRNPGAVKLGELIDDLLREERRLEHLTGDLLTLARSDEQRLTARLVELCLTDLIHQEVVATRTAPEVSVHFGAITPIWLRADAESLRRILRNLLDNAARHTTGGVWVEALVDADHLALVVSDDGPGIAPADRERVFERFLRLDAARGRTEGGAGLGLPVSRALAEAQGGSLRAVEPRRGGASFELRLPLS